MLFTYLDQVDVWDAFCGTYEAIYDAFDTFDQFYDLYRGTDPKILLKDEWKAYIRVVLDSLVLRSIDMFDWMKANRKYVLHRMRN